ncbi:hypothetical protein ACIGNX_16605 [Actinosynnema sp. NPDC053489]|uniref:hypothetical protein n=1 Tax=Actinosynnema sp. NPDC053489 TaxID=3363916 RepID=UPI0037C936AF
MGNADKFVHRGRKSWWNGTTTTLCGRRYQGGDRILLPRLSGYTVCPDCDAAHRAGKR